MLKVTHQNTHASCIYVYISVILSSLTLLSGSILSSSAIFADDSVVDEISITVPVSCSMSGTGMNSHTATLVNDTYTPNIGTTTLHAFCNDSEGFAIYAAGYTGNDIGQTNSNKLVGTSASNNATIDTGIATSAGNSDVSNWAMKLTATQDSGDTTGTNAFTIDSAPNTSGGANASFSQYHVVPNEYTKVAHKNSATDMTASTGGVKLTTTYAAYISKTQVADTYTGQVIYTLVHPSDADVPVTPSQVGINFHGNGLTFTGGANKNRVVYEKNTSEYYVTVGNNYEISKTNNVNNDGTMNSEPLDSASGYDEITINGADMLKVVISYDVSDDYCVSEILIGSELYVCRTGSNEVSYIHGDYVRIDYYFGGLRPAGYENDGYYYAKIYPAYYADADNEGAEYAGSFTSIASTSGAYAETTTWNGKWYGEIPYEYEDCYWDDDLEDVVCEVISGTNMVYFEDEDEIIDYLNNNESLFGTTVELYAYNPYIIYYNGNGATAGTMSGFYTTLDDNTSSSTADLMAYNFKKNGYGFAGWSENQNATVNSNSKIYGPNEKIVGNELTFDNNREATLYAVWVPSAGNLQGWSGCSSMAIGQVTALTDTRDNNVYTVGKLADGNCWMMENLRLDNTAATLSSSNTNNPASGFTALSATRDEWCEDGYDVTCTDSMLNTNNTNIGGANASGVTLIAYPGMWDAAADDWDQYYEGNNDHSQWYGYGNYYSWYSATAGNGTSSVTYDNAAGDICPNSWSLPTGGDNGQFSELDIAMGGTGGGVDDYGDEEIASSHWRSYPNNFVYSGDWGESEASGRGYRGSYWSRTKEYSPYGMYFTHDHRANEMGGPGRTVRCLISGV